MMQLTLVVVLLLASVGMASAECAWVLWEDLSGTSGTAFTPVTGRPKQSECQALVPLYARGKATIVTGPGGEKPDLRGDTIRWGGLMWRYFCLPDIIDPRGAKRKNP